VGINGQKLKRQDFQKEKGSKVPAVNRREDRGVRRDWGTSDSGQESDKEPPNVVKYTTHKKRILPRKVPKRGNPRPIKRIKMRVGSRESFHAIGGDNST